MVWICHRCTLENEDAKDNCGVCNSRRQLNMPNIPHDTMHPNNANDSRNSNDHDLISFTERVLMPPIPPTPFTRPGSTSFTSSLSISNASSSQKFRTNTCPSSDNTFLDNRASENEALHNRVFIPNTPNSNLCFVDDHFGGKIFVQAVLSCMQSTAHITNTFLNVGMLYFILQHRVPMQCGKSIEFLDSISLLGNSKEKRKFLLLVLKR